MQLLFGKFLYHSSSDFQVCIMAESQNIEYKEIWKDEYLKWLCGFANAQGGTLFVGIDDNGNVVGIKNIKKLLDDLPNKINSGLGIIAQINTLTGNRA